MEINKFIEDVNSIADDDGKCIRLYNNDSLSAMLWGGKHLHITEADVCYVHSNLYSLCTVDVMSVAFDRYNIWGTKNDKR